MGNLDGENLLIQFGTEDSQIESSAVDASGCNQLQFTFGAWGNSPSVALLDFDSLELQGSANGEDWDTLKEFLDLPTEGDQAKAWVINVPQVTRNYYRVYADIGTETDFVVSCTGWKSEGSGVQSGGEVTAS